MSDDYEVDEAFLESFLERTDDSDDNEGWGDIDEQEWNEEEILERYYEFIDEISQLDWDDEEGRLEVLREYWDGY